MTDTYALDENHKVLTCSITNTGICTADKNDEGYLLTDGSNRSIKTGISPTNDLLIWMHTNGGDNMVYDDIDEATAWCQDMGDLPDSKQERIGAGAVRLMDAVELLEERYAGNEDALESLAWYRDKAQEVLTHNEIEVS